MGDVGPPLAGVGARLTAAQIRLRIVDPARPNRESVMPSYYKVDGLQRVAAPYRERPILDAQQIEDVIAYLRTLQ
jgi:sulfur-oxidizing protein SoxX